MLQDDLICLPPKMAASSGNIFPILLCSKVSNVLTLVDPSSLRTIQVDVGFHSESSLCLRTQSNLRKRGSSRRLRQ